MLRNKVELYPIANRDNKVRRADLAKRVEGDISFQQFIRGLPSILKAPDLIEFSQRIQKANKNKKLVSIAMGAHVIKTGISPLIIQKMEEGKINHIAMNGAGPIHDFELAFQGETSEDVAKGLEDGTFGMIAETGNFIHEAIEKYKNEGYGSAIGRYIVEKDLPNRDISILARAYELQIPITVHVGIGTDIIYQHPKANGQDLGGASMRDFDKFIELLPNLHQGGIFINFGSAVIIPEVFLKALTVARNTTKTPYEFSTGNFDMVLHYRPNFNVLSRPVNKGDGFHFTGHHEIMLPLLFQLWSMNI